MTEHNTRGSWGTFWLGPKYEEVAPETRAVDGPSVGVIPPARESISSISVEQALSIGSVYRCVSIITSSLSQMPLGVYRNGVEIDAPSVIKQPNLEQSQRQFIKDAGWSLCTHGNAYLELVTDPTQVKRDDMHYKKRAQYAFTSDGTVIAGIHVLNPAAVTITTEKGRKVYYEGNRRINYIKHLRLMGPPGADKGYGPIQKGQSELIGALKVRRFADGWFGGSGVPTGMLTTDQRLNPADAKALVEAWNTFINENGTALMQQGMRYEHLNLKPADAQFLEVQQAQTVGMARLFGVPATLLASGNEGNSNTYSNQQELFIQFLQTTLSDYMSEIEDALTSLLPRGQVVEFKEDALLRMNTVMETEIAVAQTGAGLITVNEWREAHGLPVLDEEPNSSIGEPNTDGA